MIALVDGHRGLEAHNRLLFPLASIEVRKAHVLQSWTTSSTLGCSSVITREGVTAGADMESSKLRKGYESSQGTDQQEMATLSYIHHPHHTHQMS